MLRFPLGRGLIALTSSLLVCTAGYGVASADAQPTPASTQAPTMTAQGGLPPARRVAPAKHQGRLSWQLTPMTTFFTNGNLNTSRYVAGSGAKPSTNYYDITNATRLGWQLGYEVAPGTTIYWNRTPNDSFQTMVNGGRNSPSLDLIDEMGASYRLEPNWTIGAEYYNRWRQCCAGTGDPTNPNPAREHGWAVVTSYATGPATIIGKPFSVTYVGTDFVHATTNPAAATASAFALTGTRNEGTKFTSQVTAALRIPVYHQRKFVPFVNYQLLPTYFSSQVEPIYSNAVNYGVNIVGSPLVTYTFSIRNLNEHDQGYTNPSPNVQHYSWVIVAANFHGRLF